MTLHQCMLSANVTYLKLVKTMDGLMDPSTLRKMLLPLEKMK